MARITFTDSAGVGADMGGFAAFLDEVARASATTLRFVEGGADLTYLGDLAWRRGDASGTIERLTARLDGETVATAAGLGVDAARFWGFVEAGDLKGALRLLTAGDDAIAGTRFADVLAGGGGRDVIRGLGGKDHITGGGGKDVLHGGGGDDRLYGGAKGDRLFGGKGDDRLHGGAGDDVLDGDEGRDLLYGGAGADRFVFADRFDVGLGARRDVIRDFSSAENDVIDLRGLDARTFDSGNQAFQFIGGRAFSETQGELRFKAGVLAGDVNGDGVADFEIEVAGVTRLAADDLLL